MGATLNSDIALVFLTNEAGEDEGLGHAGIETYKDKPYASVGRECGQNSRDAATKLPVEMTFDLSRVARSEYPLYAAQSEAIKQCLKKARAKGDDKEIEFFERAREVLDQKEIAILKIEDRNTTGLVGPAVPGTPFHSLVKAMGVSHKDSETSGGSFGIGKNAAFAISELQTVFYSTTYLDPATAQSVFLAQGKTILISHTSSDGKERRATGYWGKPGFLPVENKSLVPSWLGRDDVGTSLVIPGFRESPNWQDRIASSLIQNFFCGIHRGEIKFLINNGEIDINQGSLAASFENIAINIAADDIDGGEELKEAKHLYECLTSPDSIKQTIEIDGIGPVLLTMLMRDGLPKRVRIIRNGMSITDELGSFGDKFMSFPRYRDFVALVEPTSHEGNKLFKRMENPRHDALSAERLADPKKRTATTRAMRKLAKAIRQAIKAQALTKAEARIDLNELSEYFDVPETTDTPPAPSSEENPQVLTYTPAPPRKDRVEEPGSPPGGAGGGGQGKGAGGKGRGAGPRRGRGKGGRGGTKNSGVVEVTEVRNVHVPKTTGYSRRVFFTPLQSCKAMVELRAVGMDTPSTVNISAADTGSVEDGKLVMQLAAGTREGFSVRFASPYSGPIELLVSRMGA
jgi:hypothetical protein